MNLLYFLQTSLFGDASVAPTLSRNTQRKDLFEQQLLKAFSFFLNEQTTPRALWNTHHMVQSQAKTRPIQRPHMMQSPTFCAVSQAIQSEPEHFFGIIKSFKDVQFLLQETYRSGYEKLSNTSPF